MDTRRLSVSQVNELDKDDFLTRFGNIVERCSLVAAAVWICKPFKDINHMIRCIESFLDQLPPSGKAAVLRLYPDVAGRLAREGRLSRESTGEQASAGMLSLTTEEQKRMSDMNERYKRKFGFPFVICARENKKNSILVGQERRLLHTNETELLTGINEVKKICRLRLKDIVDEEPENKARL